MTAILLEVVKAACPHLSEEEILEKDRKILARKIRERKYSTTVQKGRMYSSAKHCNMTELANKYPDRISMNEMLTIVKRTAKTIQLRMKQAGVIPQIIQVGRKTYTVTREEFKRVFGV
jgi:Mor family transcriptional regulator